MIKNNKISKFLDQYSMELRRMGIYMLVIAFVFGLSLKIIADRTRLVPPDFQRSEEIGLEVSKPDDIIQEKEKEKEVDKQEEPLPKEEHTAEPPEPVEKVSSVIDKPQQQTEEITEDESVVVETIPLVDYSTDPLVFHWPVKGTIVNPFGMGYNKTFADYRFNPAIDIEADTGAEVKAAMAGTVILVENNQHQRVVIEIDHGQGLVSRYSHMAKGLVKPGDKISTGQAIGQAGPPGLEKLGEDVILHFQIRNKDQWLDPEEYLY